MSRTSVPVVLTEEELLRLAQWIRAGATPQQVVLRARIIAEAAAGQAVQVTAAQLEIHRRTVALWSRRVQFLKFLRKLDAELPDGKILHLILDNYGTHGHASVRRRLSKHPRFVLHFTPTTSSWLYLIERWFAELSQKAVRRGAFRSVRDLQR